MYWCEPRDTHAVYGEIARAFEALGGTHARLGFPTESEKPVRFGEGKPGRRQRFEGGAMYWRPDQPAVPAWESFLQFLNAEIKLAVKLGYPKSAEVELSGPRRRRLQSFQSGWLAALEDGEPYVLWMPTGYASDLGALPPDYDVDRVLSHESIAIVVGTWLGAELLDRHVAAVLRDAIGTRGKTPFERAFIVSDYEWFQNAATRERPAIALGGPDVNRLTSELADRRERHEIGRGWMIDDLDHGYPRVALWGNGAVATTHAVESYVNESGLNSLLDRCWSGGYWSITEPSS